MPSFELSGLRRTRWGEYLVRFAFGGFVTAMTGLIAKAYGPGIGGLFLAFPAILPATLTLVKQHDGRPEARKAAGGARLGAVGLIAFGATVWRLAERGAVLSLIAATIAWAAASVALWQVVYGRYGSPTRRTRLV